MAPAPRWVFCWLSRQRRCILPNLRGPSLAAGALVLGVRFMIHPKPIGPAMMTIAVLLGTATKMTAALFRAEAVALVFGLVVVGIVLDQIWRFVLGPEEDLQIREHLL